MIEKEIYKYQKWGMWAMLALFSIFIFYLNTLYPYFSGDDFIFQLKIPDDGIIGTERVRSLKDLIESQINFYLNYHYRVINHTVLQFILIFDPVLFDILNTAVFFLLPWVLLKINDSANETHYLHHYFVLTLFIWLFHLNLGWCYWPVTGALNYTWMLVPQLWYLAVLINYRNSSQEKRMLIFLAFVNSMANENVCVALFTITALIAFEHRKEKDKTLWICLGIIILGGIFMLLSPSVGKRLATQGHREAGLLSHLFEYGRRVTYYSFRYLPLALILLFPKVRSYALTRASFYLLLTLLVSTGIMVIIPLYEPRSAVFGFFIVLMFFTKLIELKALSLYPMIILLVLAVMLGFNRAPEFKEQFNRHKVNENLLIKHRGQNEVWLKRYCDDIQRDYLLCHEISEDPNYFDNQTLAAFYNINEVKLSKQLVDIERRELMFDSLTRQHTLLNKFDKVQMDASTNIYYKQSQTGLDLFIESENEQNPFFIIRGKRKSYLKHSVAALLPNKLSSYFLDYLEDTTKRAQENVRVKGKTYNYDFIQSSKNYNFLLISYYSFEEHAPIGKMYKLKLE